MPEPIAIVGLPTASGFVAAVCDTVMDAQATLPPPLAVAAPEPFSAHGLPTSYIRRGDPKAMVICPMFIAALATLCTDAAQRRGWS